MQHHILFLTAAALILALEFMIPASFRIHHSIEARHLDKNFGITFSVWNQKKKGF